MILSGYNIKAGIFGGTVASVIQGIHFQNIEKTVILGMIGATVSFFVSMFLRWSINLIRSKIDLAFQKKKEKKKANS